MRKVYGILVFILFLASFTQCSADEFKTKAKYDPYNPLVQEIASGLKKNSNLETAEAVWDWMNQNIQYDKSHVSGVENTIRAGKGQCSSQACVAASLFVASNWDQDHVRIGEGRGHMWVEIFTDKWHRFDTVHTHTFSYEYSQEIYTEGKDYEKIDYYYYDPRESPKIALKSVSESIQKDIHIITFEISNEGEMGKYLKIEVITNLEIIGSSDNFEIQISPGSAKTTKIFLKGEGSVLITIDEIRYETELYYDNSEEESVQSIEKNVETEIIEDVIEKEEKDEEKKYEVKKGAKQSIEVKKIEFPSPRKIIVSQPGNESKQSKIIYVPFLAIIPVFILLFKKFF